MNGMIFLLIVLLILLLLELTVFLAPPSREPLSFNEIAGQPYYLFYGGEQVCFDQVNLYKKNMQLIGTAQLSGKTIANQPVIQFDLTYGLNKETISCLFWPGKDSNLIKEIEKYGLRVYQPKYEDLRLTNNILEVNLTFFDIQIDWQKPFLYSSLLIELCVQIN